MLELLFFAIGAAGAGGWVAHRLKGERSWREAAVVVFGGGGPGPVKPK